MKSLRLGLLATSSCVALLGTAAAQPPTPPMMSWTGFYVGINAGAAWNHSSFTDVNEFFFVLGGGPNNNFWNNTRAGVTVGGLAGYNWQFGNFVFGLEGDINWVDGKSDAVIRPAFNVVASSNLKWISTLRGRVGATFDSANLFYLTGGLALADYSDAWGEPSNGPRFVMSSDGVRAGWTIGGGLEHMFAPQWTGRVEVLYADFGTRTVTDFDVAGTYRTEFRHSVTQARGALTFKW